MKIMKDLKPSIGFEVEENPVFDIEGNVIQDFKAIHRTDNGKPLHIVGSRYTPLSNAEFQDLAQQCAEISGSKLLGFAESKGGKNVIAYLSEEESLRVGERVQNFTILRNSHDGSSPFSGGVGEFVLRCENGMYRFVANRAATVRHTASISQRAALLPMYLEGISNARKKYDETCEQLAYAKMNERQKQEAFNQLFKITGSRELLPARTQTRLEAVENSLAREMNHYGQTAYGFLQGITHYTSNVLQTREPQLIPITGAGADLNNEAYNYLTSTFLN